MVCVLVGFSVVFYSVPLSSCLVCLIRFLCVPVPVSPLGRLCQPLLRVFLVNTSLGSYLLTWFASVLTASMCVFAVMFRHVVLLSLLSEFVCNFESCFWTLFFSIFDSMYLVDPSFQITFQFFSLQSCLASLLSGPQPYQNLTDVHCIQSF